MFDLPLFPLNTVLFPGQPLSLHIFEERYKEMINLCIDTQQPFGVVLLETGRAEHVPGAPPVKPHVIGCTAQIVHIQRLIAGRMNIIVQGEERFRVNRFKHDRAYLVGEVELYPFSEGDILAQQRDKKALIALIERYLTLLEKAGQVKPDQFRLPDGASAVAAVASMLLQGVSMEQKQALLACEDMSTLIREVKTLYKREVVLLEALLTPPNYEDLTPFSLN